MSKDALLSSLRQLGIVNEAVIEAMRQIPREVFVPEQYAEQAYLNVPIPIESDQTISQPYMVAQMTQSLLARGNVVKVLEIGTGTGYQAAILAMLVDLVYTVERIKSLHESAKARFQKLSLNNIQALYQDGYDGLVEHAPFDAIMVTAVAKEVPQALLSQLAENGRLVIPVGNEQDQQLKIIDRVGERFKTHIIEDVRFVPMLKGKI
jgi:protein-L-isoaspartate(D-aspartate) O-methyltransferase